MLAQSISNNTEVSEPQSSITGVNYQAAVTCLVDWLATTQAPSAIEPFKALVQTYWPGGKWDEQEKGTRYYRRKALYLHGITLCWEPTMQARSECNFVIPGSALATIDVHCQLELIAHLAGMGAKPTRIDIAVRDYSRTLNPYKAKEAMCNGQVRGFRTWKFWEQSSPKIGRGAAMTFGQRGKKGGQKYLRMYDKYIESMGRENCIACEAELTGIKAQEMWNRLLEIGQKDVEEIFPQLIAAHIKGVITFDGCDWWNAIMENVPAMKLPSKKRNDITVQKAMQWIHKQVKPILAMVIMYNMEQEKVEPNSSVESRFWFSELINWIYDGCDRWSPNHERAYLEAVLPIT